MAVRINSISLLSISISLLVNSIKFYEEARNQIVISDVFSRSMFWFILLLISGILLCGFVVGMAFAKRATPRGKK